MKTETKHTPGINDDYRLEAIGVDIYENSECLAQCCDDNQASRFVEACNNYERVKAQRDELAAALKYALDDYDDTGDHFVEPLWVEQARAALAKLEADDHEN